MRDQWRAEDDRSARHRDRATERPRKSPSASRRRDRSTGGLRIRGRAADDTYSLSHKHTSVSKGTAAGSRREVARNRSRSTRRERGDERPRGPRDPSDHPGKPRARYRDEEDLARHRRRSRSRSPPGQYFDYRDREERRRPASPPHLRTEKGYRPSSQRTERAHSPPTTSRGDHYTSASRLGDSYIPSSRQRSPSPPLRERRHKDFSLALHRSRSRDRCKRYQEASLTSPRRPSPRPRARSPPRGEKSASIYRPRPRSPHSRKDRKESRSPLHTESHHPRHQKSRSPDRKRSRRKRSRDTSMQHSQSTSPPRPIPSFDASNQHRGVPANQTYPLHGMKANDVHGPPRQMRPPRVDTRQPYSTSPQWTPTSSHHGSPNSASPYGQVRGGWGSQPQQYSYQTGANAYSPPPRQNSYPPQPSPQSHFYPSGQQSPYANSQQPQHGYQHQNPRGGHSGYRGNHYSHSSDRRFSGPGQSPTHGPTPSRGRGGHFQNLQWTASSSGRGRGDAQSAQGHMQTSPQQNSDPQDDENDNPFRPSKDLQVEDEIEKETKTKAGASSTSPKESSKVKFAFKAKAPPPVSAKPPPDLTQRMKQPPRKDDLFDNKLSREDRSDFRRGGERDGEYRSRDDRFNRETRQDRDQKRDRGRERSPDAKMEKRVMKRKKPKRTLSPSLADSTSVYYRKPGNESVVGSGTYGKVFKAIHVYTKNLAALKKIRMDGEKDGFPVTAVREIKLLQSLKHDNVVSLQEVMVEHNDCFMVFEYLSHDLTGLLNHPTFKLEHAHKKHLGSQLFEGLNYLHRRGVLHRDIKAANILVSNQGQLKLADFGLARFYSKRGKPDYTNRVITIWYRSPELLLGETQYGPAVDIWSAACVMVEIFTRHAIFPGDGGEINQLDKIYNVLGTPTRSEWPGLVDMAWFELLRPTERKPNTFTEKYQERVTPAAFELLTAMFLYDPNKRPTAGDVLEHPYFTTEEPAPRQALEWVSRKGNRRLINANNSSDLRISKVTGTNLNPKHSAKKTNGKTKKPEEPHVQKNMKKRRRRGEQVAL